MFYRPCAVKCNDTEQMKLPKLVEIAYLYVTYFIC